MTRGTYLLTTGQVASRLRVSTTTVINWAERGLLTCSRTEGDHRRFDLEDVERLAEELTKGRAS